MRLGRLWCALGVLQLAAASWVFALVWAQSVNEIAAVQVTAIRIAVEAYRAERGELPGLTAPGETQAALYHALLEDGGEPGPFLYWDPARTGEVGGRPVLLDPWGRPIVYRIDAHGYDLFSRGPDGLVDLHDDSVFGRDDVGFWADSPVVRNPPARSIRQAGAVVLILGAGWVLLGLWMFGGRARAWWRRRPAPAGGCPKTPASMPRTAIRANGCDCGMPTASR